MVFKERFQSLFPPKSGLGIVNPKRMFENPWSIGKEQEVNIIFLSYACYMFPPVPKVRVPTKLKIEKTIFFYYSYLISNETVDSDFTILKKEKTMKCFHY